MVNIKIDISEEELKVWLTNSVNYLIEYAKENRDKDLLPEVATINMIIEQLGNQY